MKILLANHTPIFGSGSGAYTNMIALSLVRANHDVGILTPLIEKYSTQDTNVSIFRLHWDNDAFPSFTGHPVSKTTYESLNETQLEILFRCWREDLKYIAETWNPDIVHVQHFWIIAKAAISAGLLPVVTCHGSEINYSIRYKKLAEICMPVPELVGAIIYISKHVSQKARTITERVPYKVTLPNPYDDHLFLYKHRPTPSNTTPHIGFVGRLVTYKNCELFLKCLLYVRDLLPSFSATVIGDGPERQYLESMSLNMGLSKYVKFLGHIHQDHLADYYRSFDLLVVPSTQEPFGLVAIESVACGTPAVVSDDGGLRDLIHPPYIIGFKSGDLLDLFRVVIQMLKRRCTEEDRINGSQYIKNKFSLSDYTNKLLYVYNSIG